MSTTPTLINRLSQPIALFAVALDLFASTRRFAHTEIGSAHGMPTYAKSFRLSQESSRALSVFGHRDKLDVIGIATGAVSTAMIALQSIRNSAVNQFVKVAMQVFEPVLIKPITDMNPRIAFVRELSFVHPAVAQRFFFDEFHGSKGKFIKKICFHTVVV